MAFLAGLGLVKAGMHIPCEVAVVALGLGLLCTKRRLYLAVPAAIVIGLLLGLWRGSVVDTQLQGYDQLIEQKASVIGTVAQDATYGSKGQQDFMITHVMAGGHELPGQVRVTTFSPVEPRQGDVVAVSGKLKPGFGNYQAGAYFATVEIQSHGTSWLADLRRQFSAAIRNVVPEPQASLGLGFLLGIKSQLPDSLNDQLKLVGLTHIVVASGYNLTILVRAARRLLVRRSKYQATLAAVVLMVGFVGVTGLSPSMSRAALVTSLSLATWYYGRAIHPVVLLLFSAAVTAAINPLFVWGDLGWYLSFLAFAGVMLGAPLLLGRLYRRREPPQLVQIAIETLCAELATLPLTLFVFGSVSVVTLLSNMIVTPLVPVAMLATFVAGVGTVVLPGVGSWVALPAHLILNYMTQAIIWLASFTWVRQAASLQAAGMIGLYGLLCGCGLILYRKLRFDYLGKSIIE